MFPRIVTTIQKTGWKTGCVYLQDRAATKLVPFRNMLVPFVLQKPQIAVFQGLPSHVRASCNLTQNCDKSRFLPTLNTAVINQLDDC